MNYLPNSVVDVLSGHADLLVSGESSVLLWVDLATVQVKFFVVKIGVNLEFDLLAISYYVVRAPVLLALSEDNNRSSTWAKVFVTCGAGVGFVVRVNFVTQIENHETVSLFVK